MEGLVAKLGDEITDVDEETFDLFSQTLPSHDLGMIDGKADTIELTIAGHDFGVKQSPGVLQSNRAGGTTGAAIWQVSVRFAEWMGWSKNPLFQHEVLSNDSTVLELGAGISGFLPCLISPKVRKVAVTDQNYVLKATQENVAANIKPVKRQHKTKAKTTSVTDSLSHTNVDVFALDWENDDVHSTLSSHGLPRGVDLVLACDCIFNYALIDPFVQTCVDVCKMRPSDGKEESMTATVCVIAQQLRQPEVFEQWLETFLRSFRAWGMPDELLTDDIKSDSGFVVHIGVLKAGT
ncbi:hypothetical protein M409DRAFT_50314 [Zasmidium cellare ATCC 36951]|uniref:Diaminohydroxyphosphoribosylamino-pyrimidine deaminase n=1 Tax=Zasmidium cellare ATCC 36951 TaxID=1080233 RepID=A0A6A6CY43_ZASCE|nr:uncharacterized protein M409DRAFT_50314 [Zasmidium cellare ATCC 36951]KAF2171643.1 hypothetical protein M409DRAFT_50314 [Zasmidium cellare ATCC 36951]